MRLFRAAFCAAAIFVFFAPVARADQYDKLTYLTFSGPVQIPGAVLPAGTYEFKLADPESGRRVIAVVDKDTRKFYKLLLTMPNQQMKPADKPVVMFSETAAGVEPAVKAWFYPGETYGYEFVYPKDQAMKIAKASHSSVVAMDNSVGSDVKSLEGAKVVHVDENGTIADDSSKSNTAPESTIAQNNTPEPSANRSSATPAPIAASGSDKTKSAPTGTSMRRELPRTASPVELYGLLSSLSLAGAFGARQLRRRLAENS